MAESLLKQRNPVEKSATAKAAGESRLLESYLPLVRSRANAFRQKGIENEDLVQEGVIGLLYATRAYDRSFGSSFKTFAYVCITNRLRTVVASGRKPETVSLDSCPPLEEKVWDMLRLEDPQEIVIDREQFCHWLQSVNASLSDFEHLVVRCYLSGYSYQETAGFLQTTTKAVDNALQRARRKLHKLK